MRRIWLLGLCILMILTGCARAGAQTYWTEDGEDWSVFLRGSESEPGVLELGLLADEEETVIRTLTTPAERILGETFSDILNWDGLRLTERQGLAVQDPTEDWSIRTYYAVEDGAVRQIAESFGWGAPQDYSVDLDGDGMAELVSNVTYGGDGHQDVSIYQRRGDDVWLGKVSTEDLPGHDNWGVNSVAVVYDPARNIFQIRYAVKNSEDTALVETTGLERVEFQLYEK